MIDPSSWILCTERETEREREREREREDTDFLLIVNCWSLIVDVNSEGGGGSRVNEQSVEGYTQPCYTQHMEFWAGERSFPHGRNILYALS